MRGRGRAGRPRQAHQRLIPSRLPGLHSGLQGGAWRVDDVNEILMKGQRLRLAKHQGGL